MPVEKERFINLANGLERHFFEVDKICFGILYGPEDLLAFNWLRYSNTSISSVGDKNKECGIGFFGNVEKCFVVGGIFFLVFAAMDEK